MGVSRGADSQNHFVSEGPHDARRSPARPLVFGGAHASADTKFYGEPMPSRTMREEREDAVRTLPYFWG